MDWSGRAAAREIGSLAALAIALAALALWGFSEAPLARILEHGFLTPVSVVAAAIANATAIGGGFLFLPFFLLIYQLSAAESLKLALATQAFGMTSGALGWSRVRIVGPALALAALASGLGMAVGTFVWQVDALTIKSVFGWASIAVGGVLWLELRFGGGQTAERMGPGAARAFGFAVACAAGGVLNAWISIGIGEVVALYLLFVYRIRMDYAIATGVAALAFDSLLGFAFHSVLGGIRWDLLVFTAPGVVVGGRLGAKLAAWAEARARARGAEASALKWFFIAIVVIDGVVMLIHAASAG